MKSGVILIMVVLGVVSAHTALAQDLCFYNYESNVAKNWGAAYRIAKQNQILNPDAGQNLQEVTGIDGKAADLIMQRYWSEFKKPVPPPSVFLNFGGAVPGGGQAQ